MPSRPFTEDSVAADLVLLADFNPDALIAVVRQSCCSGTMLPGRRIADVAREVDAGVAVEKSGKPRKPTADQVALDDVV